MAGAYDTTTVLPATSSQGDAIDESLVAVGIKRARTVIGGETSRSSIVEPLARGSNYALPVVSSPAATVAVSSVAASASNVTLLASNTGRLGATVYNDSSTASLRVKLGSTASATSFTVLLLPGAYYEVPFGYTGQIDGIWTAASGDARVSELT